MCVRIIQALEARETFLFLHICFSLDRAAVVWAIQESISGLDPSLKMTAVGIVPCGGRKKSPCKSFKVQVIFYFWSSEISWNILRI